MKPKATTKVTVIAHKSTKEITWNHRKNINPKDGRKKKKKKMVEKEIKGHKEQTGQTEDEQQDDRLEPNHINNHTEHKWSKHPN